MVILWMASMVLDYITGSCAAWKAGEWESSVARQGLWHKLGSIFAVLVATLSDIAILVIVERFSEGIAPTDYKCILTPIVAMWYLFTELGSITENAAKLGAPIPKFLVKAIAKIKTATEEKGDALVDDGEEKM